MKTIKYSFKRAIIAHILLKNTQVSFYPFWRKRGGLVQVSFRSVARFTIVRQMALLPSGGSTDGEWRSSSHLVSLFFSLLALRSQNQRMNGSRVYYEQLGAWCNFNIRDWILRPVPLFSGRWRNWPKFCQKFYGALSWRVVTKRLNVWKR